jgi:hypothetical protein
MAFITKEQATEFLTQHHAECYEEDTFEEMIDSIADNLDQVTPNIVYAYHVFVGNV